MSPDPHCLHCHRHHVIMGRKDCILFTLRLLGCICWRSCHRTAVLNVWRRQCIWAGEVPHHGPTSALWQHCDAIGLQAGLNHQSRWFPYHLNAGRVKWPQNNVVNSCLSTLSIPALFMHNRPWWPSDSTAAPHGDVCACAKGVPRRRDTTMVTAMLSILRPMFVNGSACSQSPAPLDLTARSRVVVPSSVLLAISWSAMNSATGVSHARCLWEARLWRGYGW